MTIKELYEYAVANGKEDNYIAIQCGGLAVGGDADDCEFQGMASTIDETHDKYYFSTSDVVPAIWLCCADAELY